MQDKTEEARAALDKKQGDLIVLVYREVDEAVRTYARQAGLEMVMHYNDAVVETDRNSAANIAQDERRRLHADVPGAGPGHQPGHRQRPECQVSGDQRGRPARGSPPAAVRVRS